MLLQSLGHAMFRLESEGGVVLITDPYGEFYDYPRRKVRADLCTISHDHHDHNAAQMLEGEPTVWRTPGPNEANGVRATGTPTWHDDAQGAKRGPNLAFLIEMDGLRFLHLGDLGHLPTQAQLDAFGAVDVLMLPVGGNYTINAVQAVETMRLIRPRLTLPMHYQTAYDRDMPVDTEEPFLRLCGVSPQPLPLLRLTRQDIGEREQIALLTVAAC